MLTMTDKMDLRQEAIESDLLPADGPWLVLHLADGPLYIGGSPDYVRAALDLIRTACGAHAVNELLSLVAHRQDVDDFQAGIYNLLEFSCPSSEWRTDLPSSWTTLKQWLHTVQI